MRTYSRVPLSERFWTKVHKTPGCWLWTASKDGGGYGQITSGGHVGRMLKAHRVAYELTHGPIPAGYYVCHSCDTPACVNPAHLFLGTQDDNMRDCSLKGRATTGSPLQRERVQRGEGRYNAKLTDAKVSEMRAAYAAGGVTQRELAERYGIARRTVSQIINRKKWRHIE